jgi:DNA invertase Pin-like site-specific DNA recombinase
VPRDFFWDRNPKMPMAPLARMTWKTCWISLNRRYQRVSKMARLTPSRFMTCFTIGFGSTTNLRKPKSICKNTSDGNRQPTLACGTYLRVSTARQGESGLGLEAQRSAVINFVRSQGPPGAEIVREFVEVEPGKRADRPVLAEAIQECKANGYILLVAKLDRLSRNLHFVTALQNSKVDFVAADNPHATPFLIHILVAVAEHERNMISSRTKSALEAAKRRGTRLGNPRYQTAILKAVDTRQRIAADRNAKLRRMVVEIMERTGLTKLAEIAQALNLRGIKTNRGSQFSPTHIHRLLKTCGGGI